MWHGRQELALDWPDGWHVRECPMAGASPMDDVQVGQVVDESRLAEMAIGLRTCCVLVDDLTRPTPASRIVPPMLKCLRRAGVPEEGIFFIFANGSHRAPVAADIERKLGAGVAECFVVMGHDTQRNLVRLDGVPGLGTIMVNRFFHQADLKLAVTGVMPHFMCGFSGGAKMVMPAVCGLETIARTHEHTVDGMPASVGVVEGNGMRQIIEACAERAGLDWTANATFNADAELCGLHCGAPRVAHAAAVENARATYATEVPYGSDVAVFNAFPKDTEFIQAMAALNVWADRRRPERAVVRPGGSIVLVCAASEGLGAHELIEYGRRHFVRRDRHGAFRDILAGRELLFLAPGVGQATVRQYYPPRARLFAEWPPLLEALRALHPLGARVAVFPASALQIDSAFVNETPHARNRTEEARWTASSSATQRPNTVE